jgi:hypothetical protein
MRQFTALVYFPSIGDARRAVQPLAESGLAFIPEDDGFCVLAPMTGETDLSDEQLEAYLDCILLPLGGEISEL